MLSLYNVSWTLFQFFLIFVTNVNIRLESWFRADDWHDRTAACGLFYRKILAFDQFPLQVE